MKNFHTHCICPKCKKDAIKALIAESGVEPDANGIYLPETYFCPYCAWKGPTYEFLYEFADNTENEED